MNELTARLLELQTLGCKTEILKQIPLPTRQLLSSWGYQQGALRSKDILDQSHTFSCLAILHNAIVVWNLEQLPAVLDRLKARGHVITDEDLALVSPLLWKHANPFGRYHINTGRLTNFA